MKLGFIGVGNMAGAIIGGIIKTGLISPEEIIGSDISAVGREHMQNIYGIRVTPTTGRWRSGPRSYSCA